MELALVWGFLERERERDGHTFLEYVHVQRSTIEMQAKVIGEFNGSRDNKWLPLSLFLLIPCRWFLCTAD